MKQAILFKVEASATIGYGHLSRCLTLIEQLPQNMEGILFLNNSPDVKNILESRRIKSVCSLKEIKQITTNIYAVIIDQPSEDYAFLKQVKERYNCYVVTLDSSRNCLADLIINIVGNKSEQVNPNIYREGLQYVITNKKFIPYRNENRQLPEQVNHIIIMFGGADPRGNTSCILESLQNVNHTLSINVIIGPLFDRDREIIELSTKSRHNVSIHKNPENLAQLMAEADLAVSGCGTTFFEFSFLGTPAIVLAQHKKEEEFCYFLEQNELTLYCEGNFMKSWLSLQDLNTRQAMRRKQLALFDGQGAERIIQELMSLD